MENKRKENYEVIKKFNGKTIGEWGESKESRKIASLYIGLLS